MEAAPHRHDDGHDELLDGHAGRKRMPEPLDPLVAANDEADRDRVHSFEVLGDTRLEVEVALSRHPGGDHGLQRAGCVRAEPGEALSLARQQPEPKCREIVLVGRELRPPQARDLFGRLREGVRVVTAATPSSWTTSQSRLSGSLRSIGFVRPAASQATDACVVSATADRPVTSSRSRRSASFVSTSCRRARRFAVSSRPGTLHSLSR